MPSEHRQIVFSAQEIIAALVILRDETAILPRGRISALKFLEDGEAIVGLVSIVAKAGRRASEQKVPAEVLGAALIRLCTAERIPLARKAKKRLVRSGEGLALHLDLNAQQVPLSSSVSLAAIEANARAGF